MDLRKSVYGFTLMELIIVIMIVGIVSAIAFPTVNSLIGKAKEQTCNSNLLLFESNYNTYLHSEDIDHNEMVFRSYLNDYSENICPNKGNILYKNGKIICNFHDEQTNNDEVPYLYSK